MAKSTYSVALATYNGERYIVAQLNSILNQTVPPSEIIISDDGSKDGTLQIVEEILDKSGVKSQILNNKQNHGVIGNFTNALSNCTHDIIFTSDQDDIWMPDKAERILEEFENNADALLIFTDGELVDSNCNPLGSMWDAVGLNQAHLSEKELFNTLLRNCLVTGATMAFKRDVFKDSLPIPAQWLHDGWFAWTALSRKGLVAMPKKLIQYRQHSANVVGMQPQKSTLNHIKQWADKIKKLDQVRKIRYERYEVVRSHIGNNFTEEEQLRLNACVAFWEQMHTGGTKSTISRFVIYSKLFISGRYHQFYTGFRGYLRDLISLFVKSGAKQGKNI